MVEMGVHFGIAMGVGGGAGLLDPLMFGIDFGKLSLSSVLRI